MNRHLLAATTFLLGLVLGAALTAPAGTARHAADSADRLVTGIGGVFFKARDAAALRDWYRDHLGLEPGPEGVHFRWRTLDDPERVGRTVWGVFPHDTDYFGESDQRFMLNYRVADLDRVLAELARGGVHPVKPTEDYPYGRFAWIEDPEGRRIELWEPVTNPG